jgi:hypothetical protein
MPDRAPLGGTVNGEHDDAQAISTSLNPDSSISTSIESPADGLQIPIPIQAKNELDSSREPENHEETSHKQELDESIRPLCNELAAKVNAFLEEKPQSQLLRNVQEQTRVALGVISTALERYRYVRLLPLSLPSPYPLQHYFLNEFQLTHVLRHSLNEISISYNGGKDCLVLLILFLAALSTHPSPLPRALQSVYIISPHPFAEVTSFVDDTSHTYRLDLSHYALPMKAGFAQYLTDRSKVKAIMVGTRRTDPHGALLGHFDMTDHGWVNFMRVHPVIDWHYREIWAVSCYRSHITYLFPYRFCTCASRLQLR